MSPQVLPEVRAEPPGARRPLPLLPPRLCLGAVWKGRWEPLRGSTDWDLGRDGARPRFSLEFAASLAPGVFQSSQQRLPRSSRQGEETAASAPVSPPPARSSGLARWERPGFPAGRPSSPGRKPQLTQAAPKAEAARPNSSSRTAAPTPGACTGAQAAHRGGGPAEALWLSQSHGLPHVPSRFFFLGPGSPGQWSACGGSRAAMPPGPSRNLQPLLNSSPPQQLRGKGRAQSTTRPL